MRRLLSVGPDTIEFDSLNRACDLLVLLGEPLKLTRLLDHHLIELVNQTLQFRNMGLKPHEPSLGVCGCGRRAGGCR